MSKGLAFRIKQNIKMYIQNVYLPRVYRRAARKTAVDPRYIIMADMHSDRIPFSMSAMYNELIAQGYVPEIYTGDIDKMSFLGKIKFMKGFMRKYAAAGYVFICSYFLPVSSCKKRIETKVIQLWHSGGLLKKMGYDTKDDIPKYYRGNVTANYDLVTVSAPVCVPVWESALRLPKNITKATGLSRTDMYFDDNWNEECRNQFYEIYPEAKGKKVVLYAPSFSGNASDPRCDGIELGLVEEMKKFSGEWFLIVSLHPHLRKKYPEYFEGNYGKLPTEKILPVTNLLITDYSSVLFDYAIYKKPFILFCPDIKEYKKSRGLYADVNTFPAPFTDSIEGLGEIMANKSFYEYDEESFEEFCKLYMGECDGHSSERILEECNLCKTSSQ